MLTLRELFLQRLPLNVHMVLASADTSLDLSKLADMADKVMEVVTPTVASTSTQQTNSKVTLLCKEVARLADIITSVTNDGPRFRHQNSFHTRPAPKTPPPDDLSAGTMLSLGKLYRNARSTVVWETPRPDISGNRRFHPTFQSPFPCK